ncbi:hypothetical protein KPH14_009897 [Odynerus spinipes]|uniref:Uncharacterized protein n=1 Tax=Odynerus spinipes TaxID=1348599 RepID=A0AAD9RSK4_9HYME|nr:hypothetical protein KPH14_009897 [Odynerus spinipes]
MRVGGGRCPPLLVGGLLIACLILICNWWTLSSENIELVRQIDELNEQLKISAEERDQCVTLRSKLEQKYKHMEDEVAYLHVRLEQQNDIKKKNDELEDSIAMCKSELESLNTLDATKTATLETLRLEKDTINTQLDAKRKENKKLQDELNRVKDEMDKLKLAYNAPPNTKPSSTLTPTRMVNDESQLRPVRDSAVRISVAGQRGLKYHQIPILPTDSPGAVRLTPRLSVTMLKAKRKSSVPNDTLPVVKDTKITKSDVNNPGNEAVEITPPTKNDQQSNQVAH